MAKSSRSVVNGDLGSRIVEKRLRRPRSQTEVASFSGTPLSTYRRIEQGEPVHAMTVGRVAATLAGLDALDPGLEVDLEDRVETLERQLADLELKIARSPCCSRTSSS